MRRKRKKKTRLTSEEVVPVLRFLHGDGLVHGSFITCENRRGNQETCITEKIVLAESGQRLADEERGCKSVHRSGLRMCRSLPRLAAW